jgi:hypothetical protein
MMAAALAVGPMCSSWAIEGDGLMPARDAEQELHWQGRLSLGTLSPLTRTDTSIPILGSMSLLGDYYFSAPPSLTGNARGFRATSGLFIGARATSLLSIGSTANLGSRAFSVDRRSLGAFSLSPGADTSSTDPAATPYFGFGYSGLASKRWGFSADVGVMALNPGSAVKLGRVFNGNQSLDDVLREMRLSPLVQVGVSYSF